MKRNFLMLLVVVLSLALMGCSGGKYLTIMGNIETLDNGIAGEYSSFNGSYFKNEKFKQNEVVEFHFTKTTSEGELTAKVFDSEGNLVADLDKDRAITIDKSDTYKMEVTGKKHKGSFSLTWDVKNNT